MPLILSIPSLFFFFFNDTATTEIYTLSLHDALPISGGRWLWRVLVPDADGEQLSPDGDRKSTRLNSSHTVISYAVFCLKKKKSVSEGKGLGREQEGETANEPQDRQFARDFYTLGKEIHEGHVHHFFFFNDTATTEIYTLSLHDALPISLLCHRRARRGSPELREHPPHLREARSEEPRLNSSHTVISYAVFCLKKKKIVHIISIVTNTKKIKAHYGLLTLLR